VSGCLWRQVRTSGPAPDTARLMAACEALWLMMKLHWDSSTREKQLLPMACRAKAMVPRARESSRAAVLQG